jgi:isoleucyl-tRNA synthetase
MLNPVQGDGRYAQSLPFFGGLSIWKANALIVDKLREVGALLHTEKFTHSYMHCWRHKTPIIYRATTQWFAGMDLQLHGQVPVRRHDRAVACADRQHVPADSGAGIDDLGTGGGRVLAVPAA